MSVHSIIISVLILGAQSLTATGYRVLSSTQEKLQLVVSFDAFTMGDLDPLYLLIGLPDADYPQVDIVRQGKLPCPDKCNDQGNAGIEWQQIQKLRGLNVGILKIDPLAGSNDYYSTITITITFTGGSRITKSLPDNRQNEFLAHRILNWNIAQNWIHEFPKKRMTEQTFPSGNWLKFAIKKDGIYSISGSDLLNASSILRDKDPRSFKLFTGIHLGRPMTQSINQPIPDSTLVEVAISFSGEEDGQLNGDDQLFFYGRGASGFDHLGSSVSYTQNPYFTENVYWLLIPDDDSVLGKRIRNYNSPTSSSVTISYGIVYDHIEYDLSNPFQSGLTWVGASFSRGASYNFSFNVEAPDPTVNSSLLLGLLGESSNTTANKYPAHRVLVYFSSMQNPALTSLTWSGRVKKSTTINLATGLLTDDSKTFILKNEANNDFSLPYFDYATLSYGRTLEYSGSEFEFYSPAISGQVRFTITPTQTPTIWNITNITNPKIMNFDEPGSFKIELNQDSIVRFVTFSPEIATPVNELEFLGPSSFSSYRNQTIQAEHLILGPDEFAEATQPLVNHRENLNSRYVSLEQVYQEFSGGNPDPMAIRAFIQWSLENWQQPVPTYLLLMGDADYDYRNITGKSVNKVPTIETSSVPNSHATDDRLATITGTLPEIAIGRYPARSVTNVENFVTKLITFETEPEIGLWRRRVTLVADDAARPEPNYGSVNVGKSHTRNSEILARLVDPSVEVRKLYMMEFPIVLDASSYGVIKPEATQALFRILKEGTALINFIGHGSAHQWAQENLLNQDRDLAFIETGLKLPVWIAGTCSWGHFDDVDRESFSEEIIRLPMNGAVAIITTSRPISVNGNANYLTSMFRTIFPGRRIVDLPLGIVLQSIKTGSTEGEYFHLFGDPATKLVIPVQMAEIDSITPDTLRTLETAEVSGTQQITAEGGTSYIILQDAQQTVTREYYIRSELETLTYTLPGAILFRGQFTFTGESYSGTLRVPKDITYSDNPARLSIYLTSNDNPIQEALATFGDVPIIGGNPTLDRQGPIITFETDERRQLRSGDHLTGDEKLVIRIADPLGINLTEEIGHEIRLTDQENGQFENVTDYFIYDPNSITTGTIELDRDNSDESIHFLVKAWDNANNPSEVEIQLKRQYENDLKLYHVLNFPNPFDSGTEFTFEITQSAEIAIDIYTISGRKIRALEKQTFPAGYFSVDWNGRDEFGDRIANGVYLYRLKASNENSSVSTIGRLAKFE